MEIDESMNVEVTEDIEVDDEPTAAEVSEGMEVDDKASAAEGPADDASPANPPEVPEDVEPTAPPPETPAPWWKGRAPCLHGPGSNCTFCSKLPLFDPVHIGNKEWHELAGHNFYTQQRAKLLEEQPAIRLLERNAPSPKTGSLNNYNDCIIFAAQNFAVSVFYYIHLKQQVIIKVFFFFSVSLKINRHGIIFV